MATENDTRLNVLLIDDDFAKGTKTVGNPTTIGSNVIVVQCGLVEASQPTFAKRSGNFTIAVFQFALASQGNSFRFRNATISITVSNSAMQGMSLEGTYEMLRGEEPEELDYPVSPALKAAYGPGKGEVGYVWDSDSGEGSSCAIGNRNTGGDGVSWEFLEDPLKKTGIPDYIQSAILFDLGNMWSDEDTLQIEIRGKVEHRQWINDKWVYDVKDMTGKVQQKAGVIFDLIEGKNTGFLTYNDPGSAYLQGYNQLATIQTWENEDGDPMEEEPEPSKVPEAKSNHRQPSRVDTSNDTARPTNNYRFEPPAKEISGGRTRSAVCNEARKPQTDAASIYMTNPTSSNDLMDKSSMSVSDDKKRQNLDHLKEQLLLTRKEAALVTQLVGLAKEEKRILVEMAKLGI